MCMNVYVFKYESHGVALVAMLVLCVGVAILLWIKGALSTASNRMRRFFALILPGIILACCGSLFPSFRCLTVLDPAVDFWYSCTARCALFNR